MKTVTLCSKPGGVVIPELLIQVGKVKELCAAWGLTARELDRFLETGAVRPARHGRGKGSLRLLDERSLCDAFFAHSFKELGVRQETVAKAVARLRPRYPALLGQRPRRFVVRFASRDKRDSRLWPELAFDTAPLWFCLATAVSLRNELTHVQRGRPKDNWRAVFQKAVTELSREMQEKRISDKHLDAAIEAVRTRRRSEQTDEAVVTVPPP
jgi:DNA-binding transcriptional MerR regulator